MNIVNLINRIRRNFISISTARLLKQHEITKIKNKSNISKILICRPNSRLGNLLLVTPLLQEVENTFQGSEIELIVKGGLGKAVYANYDSVTAVHELPMRPFMHPIRYLKTYFSVLNKKYDLVINAVSDSSSGQIITEKLRAPHKSFGSPEKVYWGDESCYKHQAQKPILALRELCGTGRKIKIPNLDLKLSSKELESGKKILASICNNGKRNICIFTYATGIKKHTEDWWNKLYLELKINMGEFNIIEILPHENVSQINFKAPTYYGKGIRAVGSVLAASDVFIGADSGIMHLASAVNTPTIGLFNVTDEKMYRPYNHLSVSINTKQFNQLDVVSHLKYVIANINKTQNKKMIINS